MQHLYMNLVLTPGSCPPAISADYLTINMSDSINVYHYSAKHGYFNCRDYNEDTSTRIKVKWWAPLPRWLHYCGTKVQPYHKTAEVPHD